MIKDVIRYTPPKKWGVLCIDVWDNNGTNDRFYQKAVSKLSQFNIGAVINCSNSLKLDYNDKSVYNTFKKYVWLPDIETHNLRDVYQRIQLNMLKFSGESESSKILKKNLFNNNSICLYSKEAFLYHTATYCPDITDWIVLGGAWKICIHNAPLGVKSALEIVTHKFYIFPSWSVQNENKSAVSVHQVELDELVWSSIDNEGYRLITKVGGKWQR